MRSEIASLHRQISSVSEPPIAERLRAKPRRLRRLTQDEEAAVEAGYLGGLSIYGLGAVHGISRKTVSAILHRRNVPLRRTGLDDQQVAEAIRLYEGGASTLALGRHFKVDDKTVGRALKRAGVRLRRRGPSVRGAR